MNSLLQRQIQKFFGNADALPKELMPLFDSINEAYEGFEKDRDLIERSLDISSKELREVNQKLRREVEVRKQAEKKQAGLLEEVMKANEELTRFAYVITHDLKSPLRGISTLATWIMDDHFSELSEEAGKKLNQLTKRTKRMHELIDGLLEYTRIQSLPEQIVPVDLNEVIKKVIISFELPESIKINVKRDLPTIECERSIITRILRHLIDNAVKFMDKSSCLIEIQYTERPEYWEFSVSDNGPGIDEKYFEKIFKMFQTLERWEISGSTGIGLPLVKKAVEILGGRIWVESEVGQGSVFYFTIPRNIRTNMLHKISEQESSMLEETLS